MIKKMLKKIKKIGIITMLLLINLYLFYILLFCNILINTKKQMIIILIQINLLQAQEIGAQDL